MADISPTPWATAPGWESVIVDARERPVAVVLRGPDAAQFAANRALILAAPDLLNACTLAEHALRCSGDPIERRRAQQAADAAIRAALSQDDYRALCIEVDAWGGQQG